jgi:hypothetical protein
MIRVMVGLPTFAGYEYMTQQSVRRELVLHAGNIEMREAPVVGLSTPKARNALVMAAREYKATHIWFVDADMVVPPNALSSLLSRDVDIVGGYYHNTRNGTAPCSFMYDESGKLQNFIPKSAGLIEVAGTGTGCMLIRISVFDAMEKPYFNYDPDEHGELMSEDVVFCRKAAKSGFKIYCDAEVRLGHIGKFVIWPDDENPQVRIESVRTS